MGHCVWLSCTMINLVLMRDDIPPRHNKGKQVALAVARGLCFMHQNGVVHRCDPPRTVA